VKFFKIGDLFIYAFILMVLGFMVMFTFRLEEKKPAKAEIYVNNELKYVYDLQVEPRKFFVETDIGGCDVIIKDNSIRILTSFSPKKLAVKQGWISKTGETLIGIPDKLLIKIVGESQEEVDEILK